VDEVLDHDETVFFVGVALFVAEEVVGVESELVLGGKAAAEVDARQCWPGKRSG